MITNEREETRKRVPISKKLKNGSGEKKIRELQPEIYKKENEKKRQPG